MKKTICLLRKFILLGMLAAALLFQVNCSSNNSNPSSPGSGSAPTNTFTPTATAIPVTFVWANPIMKRYFTSGTLPVAYTYEMGLYLQVNGAANSSAGVTLHDYAKSLAYPIPYSSSVTTGGQPYALYDSTAAFAYYPGDQYALTTSALGSSAASTIIAPGNISMALNANGAVTLTHWAVAGILDEVAVQEQSPAISTLFDTGTGEASPVTISPATYSGGSGSTYLVNTIAYNTTNLIYNGSLGASSSPFTAYDDWQVGVALP